MTAPNPRPIPDNQIEQIVSRVQASVGSISKMTADDKVSKYVHEYLPVVGALAALFVFVKVGITIGLENDKMWCAGGVFCSLVGIKSWKDLKHVALNKPPVPGK